MPQVRGAPTGRIGAPRSNICVGVLRSRSIPKKKLLRTATGGICSPQASSRSDPEFAAQSIRTHPCCSLLKILRKDYPTVSSDSTFVSCFSRCFIHALVNDREFRGDT